MKQLTHFNQVPKLIAHIASYFGKINQLIKLRLMNRTYLDTIDNLIDMVWMRLIGEKSLDIAFQRYNTYVLRQSLRFCPITPDFVHHYCTNMSRKVDELCLEYLHIDSCCEINGKK